MFKSDNKSFGLNLPELAKLIITKVKDYQIH